MPRGQPATEVENFPTTGIDDIRADDPDAIVQGSATAPKAIGGGKIVAVLTGDMKLLLVHQRASGRFKVYVER